MAELSLHWRAESQWRWPTYGELFQKIRPPRRPELQGAEPQERRSLARRFALHIDDGLGGHLETLELAKPFLAWAEWDETP